MRESSPRAALSPAAERTQRRSAVQRLSARPLVPPESGVRGGSVEKMSCFLIDSFFVSAEMPVRRHISDEIRVFLYTAVDVIRDQSFPMVKLASVQTFPSSRSAVKKTVSVGTAESD